MNKQIILVGLNYKTAPLEVRERFALTDTAAIANGEIIPLGQGISECIILSTCNRVEILAAGRQVEELEARILSAWATRCGCSIDFLSQYIYTHINQKAVEHLFTVASSLDSMVLGEPQILGQLKDAYRHALEHRRSKVILNRLLHKSFSVAKRVRTETGIAASAVSISYAAVELAKRIFDDMSQINALLIGAGEMAELAATHLLNAGIRSLGVANRTHERAVQLAYHYKGIAVSFDQLIDHLAQVDIVISSTGAHQPIIYAKDIRNILKRRKNRPMFFIDIAVPRDIDPEVNNLDNMYLYDIDDLKEVINENLAGRREEAEKAKCIIRSETHDFFKWVSQLELQPTIVDLIRRNERILHSELEKTLKRLGPVSPETRSALEAMLHSIAKKLNHEPIAFLKRRNAEKDIGELSINTVRRIFNLDDECIPHNAHLGRRGLIDE